MKRTVSLVIALTLSFLMMFSSGAIAGGVKAPISIPTSESVKLEITLKVPPAQTNQADSLLLQEKAKVPVLQEEQQKSKPEECEIEVGCNECSTTDGKPGRCVRRGDNPCDCQSCRFKVQCDCTINGLPGKLIRVGSGWQCLQCD